MLKFGVKRRLASRSTAWWSHDLRPGQLSRGYKPAASQVKYTTAR
ncbi:hypothetical protein ACLB1T_02890 [Escherichia coli]